VNLFKNNGYPTKLIDSSIKALQHIRTKPKKSPCKRICLPFIDDKLTSKVNGILRSSGLTIRAAWNNKTTIKSHLIRSALQPPPCPGAGRACHTCRAGLKGRCHTAGVIYEMTCTQCQHTYIGETGRMVRLRYNEHLADAKHGRQETPWGDHFACHQQHEPPSPVNITIKILQRLTDICERKIGETIHLREQRPLLNTQSTSWNLI